jgi:integrase
VGRPPLDRETYGEIRVYRVGNKFEARTYYRDRRGKTSQPSARGDSETAAKRALKKKLTAYQAADSKSQITRDSRFREVAELLLTNVRREAREGAKSHNTTKAYATSLKTVNEHLADLRMWEFEEAVDVVNDTVQAIKEAQSYESAAKARTVISLVAQLAIRRRAISINPVRSIEKLTRAKAAPAGQDDGTPAMTERHIQELLPALDKFCTAKVTTPQEKVHGRRLGKRGAVWEDLPELAEASLATGTRFGETLALTGDDVVSYVDEKTGRQRVAVLVDAHLVRRNKEDVPDGEDPVQRVPGRKSNQPGIFLRVPTWSEVMFLRRKDKAGAGPLFPNFSGGWLDQDNANKRLREALDGAGFAWVTAKVWRRTLGDLMREAGKNANDVAAQLGNTPAVAQRHYMGRPLLTEVGAEVLELIKPRLEMPEFPTGKPSEERNHDANDDGPHRFGPATTVGATGFEPATARRSNDLRLQPTRTDSPAKTTDHNRL